MQSDNSTENQLYSFIIDNPNLELLESNLNEFNPLKVLDVEKIEIRHSNVLAWLLNPNENHSLGDEFFKKFICDVINQNEEIETKLDIFEIHSKSFYNTIVHREYRVKSGQIDILLEIPDSKIIVLIENKIKSKESKNQLKKYYDDISKKFKSYKILPIYLTLEGDDPSLYDIYCKCDYVCVLKNLKSIVDLKAKNLNPKVVDFLRQYLELLEEITMSDKKIEELCKKIYHQHKDAIDKINEYVTSSFDLDQAIDEFMKQSENNNLVEEYRRSGSMFWFTTPSIRRYIPKVESNWVSNYPICFWFNFRQKRGRIGLVLEIGPFDKPDERLKFITYLKNKDIEVFNKITDKALRLESKYTRFFSLYMKFEDWDNQEKVFEKINQLYNHDKTKKARESLDLIVKEYFKDK
jgi:Holliday junction resolvase-like predicted endonuclease